MPVHAALKASTVSHRFIWTMFDTPFSYFYNHYDKKRKLNGCNENLDKEGVSTGNHRTDDEYF
jgi:hypothetical protein